jgi:hypothetical protein
MSKWEKVVHYLKWVGRIALIPTLGLLLVIGAIALAALGFKNIQIGGLLGSLLGKKSPGSKAIDVANSIPPDRVDANGKIISQGQADDKGMTQAVVVSIHSEGVFSNPGTVKFTPPGETKPIEITLPTGVKNSDVEQVVVVQPGKFVVTVKDKSGVDAKHVDDLLAKYGG